MAGYPGRTGPQASTFGCVSGLSPAPCIHSRHRVREECPPWRASPPPPNGPPAPSWGGGGTLDWHACLGAKLEAAEGRAARIGWSQRRLDADARRWNGAACSCRWSQCRQGSSPPPWRGRGWGRGGARHGDAGCNSSGVFAVALISVQIQRYSTRRREDPAPLRAVSAILSNQPHCALLLPVESRCATRWAGTSLPITTIQQRPGFPYRPILLNVTG